MSFWISPNCDSIFVAKYILHSRLSFWSLTHSTDSNYSQFMVFFSSLSFSYMLFVIICLIFASMFCRYRALISTSRSTLCRCCSRRTFRERFLLLSLWKIQIHPQRLSLLDKINASHLRHLHILSVCGCVKSTY